ncbi:uncharacterized protein DUF3578 [Kribbella sp. VKM Ac-2569]|uniref:MrcB family domain-containing protein n=1 Tax=Kribbella sp. VKM Ac-2569 TaxID=2512220 RepID=UPI00102B99CD|nr:DUF3578 domain-containing protein [Kribbella sp. VKM Ac-2569]RZT07457.1 uncharacterized protein DUF3578 [Kribbella sp. VKM Ac-2569]
MRSEFEEVLSLQPRWSSQNTPEMKRRGQLIRSDIALRIKGELPSLNEQSARSDLAVEGRDGTGLKSMVPWVRIYSPTRSPTATRGWYLVYLFSGDGDRVYLSLNQGTTVWGNGEFRQRPPYELGARVKWARDVLDDLGVDDERVVHDIDLGTNSTELARGYELGNVVALEYRRGQLPSDGTLLADLKATVRWLGETYRRETVELAMPGEPAPDIADADLATRQVAGRARKAVGQGFKLDVRERVAIEQHAVRMVTEHLHRLGYEYVRDVGAIDSYDLYARNGSSHLRVEVKGTTSAGSEIILTRAEVELHRAEHPDNALGIVHSIELDREADPPTASGGTLVWQSPWLVDDGALRPMAYKYTAGL